MGGAHSFAGARPGPALAPLFLPPIQQADLFQNPARYLGRLFLGLEETAPRVCPTAEEVQIGLPFRKRGIRAVAVTLEFAGKVFPQQRRQTPRRAADVPFINDALAGHQPRPQIALPATPLQQRILVAHGRLVHLRVAALLQFPSETIGNPGE